jgi:DNA-binding transcriptional MerR regulator
MLSIGEFARLGQVSPRTLRHYAEVGILEPAHIATPTGYRYYELAQLTDLRRVLALRDLHVGLEQIRELMTTGGGVSVEQLWGMLRLREAEISQSIAEQQDRLRRVAAQLDAIERGAILRTLDIVVKTTEPLRLAETTGIGHGYGFENIHPVFEERLPVVWARVVEAGIEPGISAAHYEWPDENGDVVVHLGFDIGDQPLTFGVGDEVRVAELPSIEVAAAIHRGSLIDISETFEAVVRWIDASGYRIADHSRELYLEWNPEDAAKNVTELQLPIARA